MVGGLLGGHSGDDINKNRGNAVKLLNRILWNAYQEFDARIADINAGNLRNAIAREGWAVVTLPKGKAAAFRKYVAKVDADFKNEFHTSDPGGASTNSIEITLFFLKGRGGSCGPFCFLVIISLISNSTFRNFM